MNHHNHRVSSTEIPTLAHFSHFRHFRHFSSLFFLYTCRGFFTDQPFYAKQTQFPKKSNDVNPYNTTDYERKRNWTLGENKPNSNPNKPNFKRAKMNINSITTKDYRKKDDFLVRINKPNLPEGKKLMQSVYLQRIMKNNADMGSRKTNPIQTQFQRLVKMLINYDKLFASQRPFNREKPLRYSVRTILMNFIAKKSCLRYSIYT
jgi:hypothetical protein